MGVFGEEFIRKAIQAYKDADSSMTIVAFRDGGDVPLAALVIVEGEDAPLVVAAAEAIASDEEVEDD